MYSNLPSNLFDLFDLLEQRGVPETEYWKHVGQFIESKTRQMHIAVQGNFELTPLCNFDCKMCYVHLDDERFSRDSLLPVETWKSLADSAIEFGMKSAALTGGECLTYPGFEELYVHLVSSGIKTCVMSNGYLINEHFLELFREYRPSLIQISLYGSSEEAYESVTGVRAFERVMHNIVSIRNAGLPIKLSITPSASMRADVANLICLAEDLKIRYGVNPWLMQPREATGRQKDDLSIDDYLDIHRLLFSVHHAEVKPVDWQDVPEVNHTEAPHFGIRCGAGRSSFGIRHDGAMCPCLSLSTITAWPLEVGFKEAWRQTNVAAERYPLPLECGDCVYQRHCLTCVAVHKAASNPGHCDPLVCERMKRLVKEGYIPLKGIC